MGKFVENGFQAPGTPLLERQHDEVFIRPAMEKARKACGPALIQRQKRLQRRMVRKCHYHDRSRSYRLGSRQGGIRRMKLLESAGQLGNFLSRPATVRVEMRAPRLKPGEAHKVHRLRRR